MKTVNELKQLPSHVLSEVISHDVDDERDARLTELNQGFLSRHQDVMNVPESIRDSNKEFALHYTLGGLQALLRIAIIDLQHAEIELQHSQEEIKCLLKTV